MYVNQCRTCIVNCRAQESVVEQSNLGELVHGFLKVASQLDRLENKAFDVIAFIRKTFV